MRGAIAVLVLLGLVLPGASWAGLRETGHNLSPSGTTRRQGGTVGGGGTVPLDADDDLCIFCHTPHSAAAARGLWSRDLAPVTYKLYESSTTEAQMMQPTGSSRLCLSCHDGMIAVGAPNRSASTAVRMTGSSVLGTDLSDDHPISFAYDQALAARRSELASPSALTGGVRLDDSGQMQCTSCHDAHADRHPRFLVTDPANSALCVTCHRLPHWSQSAHATSAATAKTAGELPGLGLDTVGQNGCSSCHDTHGAEHPQWLLDAVTEEGVCLACHDGRVAEKNVRRQSLAYSAHRVDMFTGVHDPTEIPATMPEHVECADCHDPHQARGGGPSGPLPGALGGVSGVTISGTFVREATFEYEVCLKCHGLTEGREPLVYRTDSVTNVRLRIDPGNPSFHPIADTARSSLVAGLLPPLTPASRIQCTSCHSSDSASVAAGNVPRGPHGSNYRPILAAEYQLDGTTRPESHQIYALCYGCHDRNVLMNRSDGFPHRLHVVDNGAGCAVCHDPHGSRQNGHLIDFMKKDLTGQTVVTASSNGRLEYLSRGPGSGSCSLSCHGADHASSEYPFASMPSPASGALRRAPRLGR